MSSPIEVKVSTFSAVAELAKAEVLQAQMLSAIRSVAKRFVSVVKDRTPVNKKKFVVERKKKRLPGQLKESIDVIESKSVSYARVYVGPSLKGKLKPWYAGLVFDGHKIYRNPGSKRAKKARNVLKRYRLKHRVENVVGKTKRNPWTQIAYMANRSRLESELQRVVGDKVNVYISMKSR